MQLLNLTAFLPSFKISKPCIVDSTIKEDGNGKKLRANSSRAEEKDRRAL